jgi:hypothetical protein
MAHVREPRALTGDAALALQGRQRGQTVEREVRRLPGLIRHEAAVMLPLLE